MRRHQKPWGTQKGCLAWSGGAGGCLRQGFLEEVLSKLESQTLTWEVGKDEGETGESPSQLKEGIVLNSFNFALKQNSDLRWTISITLAAC